MGAIIAAPFSGARRGMPGANLLRRLSVRVIQRVVVVLLMAMGVTGCGTPGPIGYTCCNMRHEGAGYWINELHYTGWPIIPVGSDVAITDYGRYRARATIRGKSMYIGQDYTRSQIALEEYIDRLVVKEDPKIRIATFPPDIQTAIKKGKVMLGMTREQVVMAVGYPLMAENPDFDAPMWRMWVSSFGEYQLIFGRDGTVKEIVASEYIRNIAILQP